MLNEKNPTNCAIAGRKKYAMKSFSWFWRKWLLLLAFTEQSSSARQAPLFSMPFHLVTTHKFFVQVENWIFSHNVYFIYRNNFNWNHFATSSNQLRWSTSYSMVTDWKLCVVWHQSIGLLSQTVCVRCDKRTEAAFQSFNQDQKSNIIIFCNRFFPDKVVCALSYLWTIFGPAKWFEWSIISKNGKKKRMIDEERHTNVNSKYDVADAATMK